MSYGKKYRAELDQWKSRVNAAPKNGVIEIVIPPRIPGLKRIHDRQMNKFQWLELHPLNASNRK